MGGKSLALMCDKGGGSKVWDGENFPKIIIHHNFLNGKVEVRCIGNKTAGNSSTDDAEGMSHGI